MIVFLSQPIFFQHQLTIKNWALDVFFSKKQFCCMLVLPVIFEGGRHDPRSFHANVDILQAEGERVCELH